MKSNETRLHRCGAALIRQGYAAWRLLGKYLHRRSVGGEVMPKELPPVHPDPHLNPLDQIKHYLLAHGLSRQVHVRFDEGAGDYVVEDDDGLIHAKDYDKAVAVIDRTWLWEALPTDGTKN